MESDIIFKVEKKKTGRICHQFYDQRNGFKYRRKTLKPTGQAYFVCCEKKTVMLKLRQTMEMETQKRSLIFYNCRLKMTTHTEQIL